MAAACGALVAAGAPAQAQSWNMYQNYSSSFFVPFVGQERLTPDTFRKINLTLNNGPNATVTTPFTMDTGSTGIAAGTSYFQPRLTGASPDIPMGGGQIIYTSSTKVEIGTIYLTDVIINGANNQTITARVPILAVDKECNNGTCYAAPTVAYMGVGFGRGGFQSATGAALGNINPFLGLTGPLAANMRAGYVITNSGSTPGVTLGLTNANTAGFGSFIKLLPNGTNTAGCSTPTNGCFYDWTGTTASLSVNNQPVASNASVLPDSGILYMIVQAPGTASLPSGGACPPDASGNVCAPNGTTVQISLPGMGNGALYQFTVGGSGNPFQPGGVAYFTGIGLPANINTGVGFYGGIDYLYDPVAGYVGYRLNAAGNGFGSVAALLALQGNVAFDSGFVTDFPVLLMPAGANLTGPANGTGLFNGSLFGPGALTISSGNFWLNVNNFYTGGTTVNGGSLTLGPGGNLPVGSALTLNGGTFNLNGNMQVLGSLGGNGGTLSMGGGMLLLATTAANTFGSSITGNGMFLLQGGGSLNLTGNSSTFSGATVVSNASLSVNGNLGGTVYLGPGGVLGGNGTVGAVYNGGIVGPGNSIGTMSVAGNYTQTSAGTYLTEVVGSGQSDRINVGGTATLGGQVFVSALPGLAFAPSTTYTILNAAGGLGGTTFSSVNELYPFLQSSLSYDPNNVYLTLQVGGFAAQALNPTQYAVGAVLDANAPTATGDFATVLGTLATATAQQGQAVMTALSGNNYAGFSTSMVQGAQLFMNNFANQTGGGGSPVSNRVALAEACDVACDTTQAPQWGAWGGALGGLGVIGASQPVGTVTYNVGGFAAGLDRLITPTTRLGVTAGYTNGTQWVGGFDGLGRTDTFQTGLYGGYSQGPVYADAIVGYAYSYNQMWRNILVPGLQQRTAQGRTGANQFYGQLETGYRFDLGTNAQAFVTPFARLQAYTGSQNAFTETGAQSLNLTVAQQGTNSLRSVIGAQIGGALDLGWREKLALQIRLGWSHEYADINRPVTATLAGAPVMPFTTFGVAPQRDGAVIGLSANTAVADATSIYLRYEGDISGQDSAHALTAGVRMTW